jgi:thiamine monophosphate kinase
VTAPDEDDVMQRWAVEWGGAGQLAGQGMTRATLKAGDVVIITGAPGRNRVDHRLRMNTLVRPSDGFSWGTRAGERFN